MIQACCIKWNFRLSAEIPILRYGKRKNYSDEQFVKQIQPLVEAKSGLHPVKGQATFPALVPDLSIFMQMSPNCTVLIGLVQIAWYRLGRVVCYCWPV